MSHDEEELEVVHGSGIVFRDFADANAERLHMKAVLAGQITHALDARKLTVRAAAALTGFAAADFSRVRQAKVQGFTLDKLVGMLGKLDQDVELSINVRPRGAVAAPSMVCRAPVVGKPHPR